MSVLKKNLAKDYALTLSWRYAEVEFLGLPNLKDERVFRLEHIYVPLRLCHNWADRFDKEKTFYVPKALQENRHLVILGDPGSGKSTLIKVLTYAFGEADSNAYKRACGELIPIPIILRDYKTRSWQGYTDMLRAFIATLDEEIKSEVTTGWLLEQLRDGKAILMIDGLDEVGSREDREHLRDKVVGPLLSDAPKSYAVLTSRIVGYEEVAFESYFEQSNYVPADINMLTNLIKGRCYVAPFDDDEIAQFITRWYQMRETFADKQREGVESLMRALNQNDRVKRLANNPQLLTLMALIHRVTANLPSGRVELYDKIVEAYLETIQMYRKLGTPAKLDEMKRWLAKIGWEMQVRRDEQVKAGGGQPSDNLVVSREEIRQWLIEAIAKERGQAEAAEVADNFLVYVAQRSGLLVPLGPERFGFSHLTFQEYFAAFALRSRVRRFDELAETCAGLAVKRHWHETLNLLFEMLTEFPGASDDLFDEIEARAGKGAEMRVGAAKLFSSLLLDEQSGLSEARQYRAVDFALTTVCDHYDQTIIADLSALPNNRLNELIRSWFLDPLYNIGQPDFRKHFFITGSQLVKDWPVQLLEWLASPAYHRPTDLQLAEIILIGAGDEETYHEIFHWAVERLPLELWLRQISQPARFVGGFTLAHFYRNTIYTTDIGVSSNLLLLELSTALVITKWQIFRSILPLLYNNQNHKGISFNRADRLEFYLHGEDDFETALALQPTINRVIKDISVGEMVREFVINLAVASQDILQVTGLGKLFREVAHHLILNSALKRPLRKFTIKDKRLNVLFSAADALWYFPESIANLRVELQNFLQAQDDWSRLLAASALLMLGEGTPDLCRERNTLIDIGINRSAQFSFPGRLQEESEKEEFRQQLPKIFNLVFSQGFDRRWLRPEFFDPAHTESKYFLSSPQELITLAVETLKVEEETDEAK